MKKLFLIMLILTLNIPISYAEKNHENHATGVESLSKDLRGLLQKEMIALQDGMMKIIPAYISGDWEEIGAISLKMKDSYILKKNLSSKQIEELHSSLSPEFIKQDQEFHYLAGMLNHAAKSKKPELIGFYLSKLGESCVSCHSQYAIHKFPAFTSANNAHDKEHSH